MTRLCVHTYIHIQYKACSVLTEVDVEGGQISNHAHTHQGQQSHHSHQDGEHGVGHLRTKQPDVPTAGGGVGGGGEVFAAGVAEALSPGKE